MKNLFLTFTVMLSIALTYFSYHYYREIQAEDELNTCIESILSTQAIDTISVETNSRGESPILNGIASTKDKNNILKLINKNCQVAEIQDFIGDLPRLQDHQAFIKFSIDEFNNMITIKGALNNQIEFDDILKSFNTAKQPMQVQHDIKIDTAIPETDFSVDITLLLSSINEIRVADITIKNGNLIIKGLVRDKLTELETINKLHQLFDDEFNVINALQQVADSETEINDLKFDLLPLPEIKNPMQKKQ